VTQNNKILQLPTDLNGFFASCLQKTADEKDVPMILLAYRGLLYSTSRQFRQKLAANDVVTNVLL